MSAWTNGTYTKKGLALLAKLTQGSSLKITKAVTGTGYVTPTNLSNQTAVNGIKQNLSFMAASYPKDGTCKLPMFLTNEDVSTKYTARQIGLYAMDPDLGEILYFIAQSSDGTMVPSATEMPDYSATWTFYFQYGQADNVNVTVDPSHTITADMLNEVRVIAETGVSDPNKGAVLAIKNTAELPFANLRLFGKTTQNGTPTPDNPVELVSVENPTVTVYGKNVLKLSGTKTQNGVTLTLNDDGTYTLSGTSTGAANVNIGLAYIVAGRRYKPTVVVYSGEVKPAYWNFETQRNMNIDSGGYLSSDVDTEMSSFVYTDRAGVTFNAHFAIMLELVTDSETGVYEPYKEEQTLTVSTPNGLPGIPVRSGGNYTDEDGQQWICDEIDLARGMHIQRVYTETVALSYDETYSRYVGQLSKGAALRCAEGSGIPLLSNILTFNPNASLTSNGIRISSSGNKMLIACYNGQVIASATVAYPLETPIETALSEETIAAFDVLHTNNPVTTITNNGDANMEADCFLAQHEAGFKRIINYVQRYLLKQ